MVQPFCFLEPAREASRTPALREPRGGIVAGGAAVKQPRPPKPLKSPSQKHPGGADFEASGSCGPQRHRSRRHLIWNGRQVSGGLGTPSGAAENRTPIREPLNVTSTCVAVELCLAALDPSCAHRQARQGSNLLIVGSGPRAVRSLSPCVWQPSPYSGLLGLGWR